jgi:ligand-binding SRPBCC domain-containing protein
MPEIHLITKINAPVETVFDLARNIDVHQFTASQTNERAIAGTTSGAINLGETVTWKGKHFGLWLTHKSKITAMVFPEMFVDEMEKGHFKSFRHEHLFKMEGDQTLMIDHLVYDTPYGIFGKWFDKKVLKKYLTDFLITRNEAIKTLAEKQHQRKP